MKNIDDTDVVTYKSDNAARDDLVWLAYVVFPNGEYWGVRFNGATEEIARSKAIALWNKEREKYNKTVIDSDGITHDVSDPWAAPIIIYGGGRNAGKVWMRSAEGEFKRVALTEIGMYEKNGFRRSGPRSK